MGSIFSRIIAGEIPSYFIGENDLNYAFLDISPVQRGHVLVVPKIETDRLFDLEPERLSSLMLFAQQVAHAMKQVITCDRIGLAVIGLEVPHAHVHLIPINALEDMDFTKEKKVLSNDQMSEIAAEIHAALHG